MPTRGSESSSRDAGGAVRYLAPTCVAVYLLLSLLYFGLVQRAGFMTLRDVGYGDSYIFRDVLSFEKTGIIYHSRTAPPYLPVQYSPLVYILYSIPKYFQFSNLFLGPRLVAFALFLACLGMAVLIVRKLIPVRFAWLWGLLLILATQSMDAWVLQLRGDFAGILFGLATMRLLISKYRHAALAAGLCAGAAVQIKLTMMAAGSAGVLWLLLSRRWKDAGLFAAGAVTTALGISFAYWLREPGMISQMTALSPGIWDVRGCIVLFYHALKEPITLLSLLAVPFVISHPRSNSLRLSNWSLMLLYVCCAFGFALLADLQAGGNINYFFEAFFAMIPFAVLGVLRLFRWCRYYTAGALVVAGVIVFCFIIPDVENFYLHRDEYSAATIVRDNLQLTNFQAALNGRRIFSIDPRVALFDPDPPLTEPYLLSYLRRMGHFDVTPLLKSIGAAEFDVFVSPQVLQQWRGLHPFEGQDLARAVSASYKPYCVISGDVVRLTRVGRDNAELENKLRAIGCTRIDY